MSAEGEAEREALLRWIEQSPSRAHALSVLLEDDDQDEARQLEWARALAAEGGGVSALVVGFLCRAAAP